MRDHSRLDSFSRRRKAAVICLTLVLAAGLCLAAAGSHAREKALAEVRGFTDRFNEAYESNDLKVYWEFYADDMTQYWEEGRLGIYTKMLRPDGTTAASWHQETDVLFKRTGRWQVVHLHDSPAPAEK